MKISGDSVNLNPQPLPIVTKRKTIDDKAELQLNKSRLIDMKRQMKIMREQIKKFTEILRKEIGDDVDIKELLRLGHDSGWQSRAQTIMTLRIKLIAMRSKFLDPPHKMYYRGPFDPKKEFDLKLLPQKQDNLYKRMLDEKKEKILKLHKPVEVVQKEFDDLCLMYRASRFRTKSLISKIKDASNILDRSKEKADVDLRVIEAMMAHQNLFKMMIEPETFQLDPTLKSRAKVNPLDPPEISEWAKFKRSLQKTNKEKLMYKDALLSLTGKLDEINKNLIETKKIDVENRLSIDLQKSSGVFVKDKQQKGKNKPKDETDAENEYKILSQENEFLRQFLLNSVLSAKEDFKLFSNAIDAATQEFINTLNEIKKKLHQENETANKYS